MSNEITGTIIHVGDTETVGAKGFRKRQLVLETVGKYPQQIPVDFVQDNVGKLDACMVGETATVQYDLRGREYNGRYYVSINGWRIKTDAPATTAPEPAAYEPPLPEPGNEPVDADDGEQTGDLPF